MKSWLRHFPARDILVAILVAILVLGALLAGIFSANRWFVTEAEDKAMGRAILIADGNVRLLVEHWRTIQDQVFRLHAIGNEVSIAQRSGDKASMDRAMRDLRLAVSVAVPGIVQVAATDNQGRVVWSTTDTILPNADLGQREYVRAILLSGRKFFTGIPEHIADGKGNLLPFSFQQQAEDGTPIGVGIVFFDTQQAVNLAREITRHPQDIVTLLRDRSVVLARSNNQAIGSIAAVNAIPSFEKNDAGFMFRRGPSRIDAVSRIAVLRDVPGSDLSVLVGLDANAILASLFDYQSKLLLQAIILSTVLALLAIAIIFGWRQSRYIHAQRLYAGSQAARDELLHEISDQSSDMVCVLDQDLRFIFVNKASEKIQGMDPDSMIGRQIGFLMTPAVREATHARLRSLITGSVSRLDPRVFPITLPDGETRWLESQASAVSLRSGQGILNKGIFLITRDVTARKRTEAELARVHEDLRALAESSPGVLYRTNSTRDGHGRFLYSSKNIAQLLGYDGITWHTLDCVGAQLHPADTQHRQQFRSVLFDNGYALSEYRLRHKEGRYLWFRDTATCVEQTDGTYILSGYAEEITREKEQATKLEEARRMLSLGQLASGVGHELSQPLATIGLATESARMWLKRVPAEIGPALNSLERITNMIHRAGVIIHDMRMFGQADMQRMAPTSLHGIISGALEVMQQRLDTEGVQVNPRIPPTLPPVMVPELLFQQVLINLIRNACDAYRDGKQTKPGQRTVDIDARTEHGQILLRVADQAGGVAPEAIGHLFEPFFTTKGPDKGTGLGLSVCYGIVRQAGGTLSVRNENNGAVFDISLPVAAPAVEFRAEATAVPA